RYALGKRFPVAPEIRLELSQPRPKVLRHALVELLVEWSMERFGPTCHLVQHRLQKRHPRKAIVERESPRILFAPRRQLLDGPRRLGNGLAVVDQLELNTSPRALIPLDRLLKINRDERIIPVHVLVVRQPLGERP